MKKLWTDKKTDEVIREDELTEEKGIEAIRFLQKMNGIDESEEKARAGWRRMTDAERRITMNVYGVCLRTEKRTAREKN